MFKKIIPSFLCLSPFFVHAQDWNALLKEFEPYAEESLQKCQAVGMAIAIVKDGKVIYMKGFGKRALNEPDPVTSETLFQIGSMTKSFTTALAALGVDRKWFQWEDSVVERFPSFMVYDPWVTRAFQIEDLFAQRSGLVQRAGDFQPLFGVSIDTIIHNLRFFRPVTSFRSAFAYQNAFFAVGAKIFQRTSGKTWATLIHEELFKPLGMSGSSCDLESYLKDPHRAGWHVRLSDGKIQVIPESFESKDWVYIYEATGGIGSTVADMAKWIMFQADLGKYLGKQLISKKNISRTHEPHVFVGKRDGIPHNNYYCLGWVLQEYSPYPLIWHNGSTLNVNNNMAIIPEERLGIVVLCNTRDTVVAEALTWKFFDLYFEKPSVDWTQKLLDFQKQAQKAALEPITPPTPMLPSLPLKEYAGVYSNPVYGKIVVSVDKEGLLAEIGPWKVKWGLKHYNRDAFLLDWPLVLEPGTKATFCLDAEGQPQALNIEILQPEGESVFKRVLK